MSVENLELIYIINDKDYIYIYIKFISLCYYWRYLFCVYSLSIAAAESNCNYIRPLQVSTPYLHCVSARPRAAFYSKNSIVCGRFRRPPGHLAPLRRPEDRLSVYGALYTRHTR